MSRAVELIRVELERRRRLRQHEDAPRFDWYGPDCGCPTEARKEDGSCPEHPRAREKQRPPDWDWEVWMILAGRGFGKTRTVVEWLRDNAEKLPKSRWALVGQQASDVRDILIEGESGLLSVSPPWFRPKYEPSKRRLTWPNGSMALCYSSEEPGQFRGPQFHGAVLDEFAKWSYIEECWDNLQFGLRLGRSQNWTPRVCIATTPLPLPIIKLLAKDQKTALVKGSMFENAAHLARSFLERIKAKYAGTRLGRQEIEAEILEDTPGALWTTKLLDAHRVVDPKMLPDFIRFVVAVDPSVADPKAIGRTDDSHLAEAGVVGGGLGEDGHVYVMDDRTTKGSPNEWGNAAVNLYNARQGDLVVAEANNGGALIEALMFSIDNTVPVKLVHASKGKFTRAEPVAALYEQGRVHHVGAFPELEEELTGWVPGMKSPNRLDSLVWLVTELILEGTPIAVGGDPFPGWRG
jgi:predicted phage terminase large subunit-like protein